MQDLQPLAARWLASLGADVPEALALRFKTATLIEEHRLAAVRELTANVLRSPGIAEHRPLLHGGLALGDSVYPGRGMRHTSRVALLFPASVSLRRIADALRVLEFRRTGAPRRGIRGRLRALVPKRVELRHASGMPLLLERDRPLSAPPTLNYQRLAANAAELEVTDGVRCHVPTLPDAFRLFVTAYRYILDDAHLLWQRSPLWLADLVFLKRALPELPPVPAELSHHAADLWALAESLDDNSG